VYTGLQLDALALIYSRAVLFVFPVSDVVSSAKIRYQLSYAKTGRELSTEEICPDDYNRVSNGSPFRDTLKDNIQGIMFLRKLVGLRLFQLLGENVTCA
jgi:hypothetical protein